MQVAGEENSVMVLPMFQACVLQYQFARQDVPADATVARGTSQKWRWNKY